MRAPLVKKPEAPRSAGTAFRSAPGFHPVGARREADKGPWGGPPPWASRARRGWRETGPVVQRRAVTTGSGLGGLAVSVPSDPAEREAEAIAAQVLAPAAPVAEPVRPAAGGGARVDRKCASCEEEENGAGKAEEDKIHQARRGSAGAPGNRSGLPARSGRAASRSPPASAASSRSGWGSICRECGSTPIGRLRQAARALDAGELFTVGRDVAFVRRQALPPEHAGRPGLLAHELAHVVQQGACRLSRGRWGRARSPQGTRPFASRANRRWASHPPRPQRNHPATTATWPKRTPTSRSTSSKGTHVSRVIVSPARSRVGFQTPLGMLLGDIDSDLKPGEYKLKPVLAKQQWVVTGPNVKSGLRFDLHPRQR